MPEPIRVLVADRHPLMRVGLRTTLDAEQGVILVGEAANTEDIARLCQELKPDVLLLSLNALHGTTGLLSALSKSCPTIRVLILTAHGDERSVERCLALGAAGYILKNEKPEVVVTALRAVAQGASWFSRPVAEILARRRTEPPDQSEEVYPAGLTAREAEIVRLVANGWTNARIAKGMGISEKSVEKSLSDVFTKLGVTSRVETAVWAVRNGMV